MKLLRSGLFFVTFVTLSLAVSQPRIPNTRAEGCVGGVCTPHCEYDGAKVAVDGNLNQPGKCRILYCTKDFTILITPCPFDSRKII